MDIEKQKEMLRVFVLQFETDAAIGMPVDRTRRTLLRRFNFKENVQLAYNQLVKDQELHETGDGSKGSPIIVVNGPPEYKKPVVPYPWSFVGLLVLTDFMIRMHDTYKEKGWSTELLDMSKEISKALSEYKPGRPY